MKILFPKMIPFIIPLLLLIPFTYLLIWLNLKSALPYLIMVITLLLFAFSQIYYNNKILIIVKYFTLIIVYLVYLLSYILSGPAGNDLNLIIFDILLCFILIFIIFLFVGEIKFYSKV